MVIWVTLNRETLKSFNKKKLFSHSVKHTFPQMCVVKWIGREASTTILSDDNSGCNALNQGKS